MLSQENIAANGKSILTQLQRYLNLSNGVAGANDLQDDSKVGRFLNNADWLLSINYIEFLT